MHSNSLKTVGPLKLKRTIVENPIRQITYFDQVAYFRLYVRAVQCNMTVDEYLRFLVNQDEKESS